MPIDRLLAIRRLPTEQEHAIRLAFKLTLRKLNLVDSNGPIRVIVAHTVIEIGTSGLTNAHAIAELAHQQLTQRGPKAS